MNRVRLSAELRKYDSRRPGKHLYSLDDVTGRRMRPEVLDSETAAANAKALAREQDKLG